MSDFGQGRVGVRALARPASDVLRFLLGLLVPELPAVLDLWQQLPNPFNVALGPDMNCNAAGREREMLRPWAVIGAFFFFDQKL